MYVDGFVIPVPKKNVAAYTKIAKAAGKIWREHGALEYYECVGDDLHFMGGIVGFTKMAGAKPNETVVFSWIVYRSRAHRDNVNAKVMADPRIAKMMEGEKAPFDYRRMAAGGFKLIAKS
jgi:uncharacterized protein YbaA (DUF1428 family)